MATIHPFYGLDGNDLENWFHAFFKDYLSFLGYYASSGNLRLSDFNPQVEDNGQNFEIDGLMMIGSTCVLFEYTAEGGQFKNKIKKFLTNAQKFILGGNLPLRERFRLFGVPDEKLDDFEEVTDWRLAYFGTHPEFDKKEYRTNEFTEFKVAEWLHIFKPEELEYFRQLTNLIGEFGRNELLAILGFTPADLGGSNEDLRLSFIKADGKYITGNCDTKADIYLIKFPVHKLLKMARVSRYEGIPFILESNAPGQSYQRLLIGEKLDSISEKFIANNKRKTFPNTITIALSNECAENDGELIIPQKFSSLDIIDGQHRLFGYTHENVKDDVREEAEILATAIKFRDASPEAISQNAARVFCEINSTQATVKKDLLYLIKYDVLGERDYPAVAGKIIKDCNQRSGKALEGIFLINSLKRKNALNLPAIEFTQLIDDELIPFMRGLKTDGTPISEEQFENIFEISKGSFFTDPEKFHETIRNVLERYFNFVRFVFKQDWKPNSETLLVSKEYFMALIRLLRFFLFENEIQVDDTKDELVKIQSRLADLVEAETVLSFPKNEANFPLEDHNEVYNFLQRQLADKQ